MEARMNYKVVTLEIYRKLDEVSNTVEKLKNVSYILSECMIDSDFKHLELTSLATMIHDRIYALHKEPIKILPEIEPEN